MTNASRCRSFIGDRTRLVARHAGGCRQRRLVRGLAGAVRRHTFDPRTGAPSEFISGYTNAVLPNPWDRSRESPRWP